MRLSRPLPSPFHLKVGPLSSERVQSSFDYAQQTKAHAASENERVRDIAQVVSRGNNSIVDGANDEITVVMTTRTCRRLGGRGDSVFDLLKKQPWELAGRVVRRAVPPTRK